MGRTTEASRRDLASIDRQVELHDIITKHDPAEIRFDALALQVGRELVTIGRRLAAAGALLAREAEREQAEDREENRVHVESLAALRMLTAQLTGVNPERETARPRA